MYTDKDYLDAIKFVLNYPAEVELRKYDMYKDIYKVSYLEGGWYDMNLEGKLVRSALKYKGVKAWTEDTGKKAADYYAGVF
jgi:hypothetical protein